MVIEPIDKLISRLRRVEYTQKGIAEGIYNPARIELVLEAGPVAIFSTEDFLWPTQKWDIYDFKRDNKRWLQDTAKLLLAHCWRDIINGTYLDQEIVL